MNPQRQPARAELQPSTLRSSVLDIFRIAETGDIELLRFVDPFALSAGRLHSLSQPLSMLVAGGVDVNLVNARKQTALHIACSHQAPRPEFLALLLNANIDLEAKGMWY